MSASKWWAKNYPDAWFAYVGCDGRIDVERVFPVTHAGGSNDPKKEWRWAVSLSCPHVPGSTLCAFGHSKTKEAAFKVSFVRMGAMVRKRQALREKEHEKVLSDLERLEDGASYIVWRKAAGASK